MRFDFVLVPDPQQESRGAWHGTYWPRTTCPEITEKTEGRVAPNLKESDRVGDQLREKLLTFVSRVDPGEAEAHWGEA